MFRVKLINFLQHNCRTHPVVSLNCNQISNKLISGVRAYVQPACNITEKDDTLKHNHLNKSSSVKSAKDRHHLSEKQFFAHVKLKNDPDSFGEESEEILDEGDIQEEKLFTEQPFPSQKLTTKQYADIIKSLIKKRKIQEAINVVEVRMLKEDRVKPENYIYNLLVGACGRTGYTKKGFKLYNDMKRRGLEITGGTYTSLFNACANSPWKEDCLTRARHLRNIMLEKMYEPNITNYNAMIKAFGRGGDLKIAFEIADEMIAKKINLRDDTINFLLQACITDKEAGFRHALLVWRKLIQRNIQPSLYTYNLMLKCIRDCGIGDIEITRDVIKKLTGTDVTTLQIESKQPDEEILIIESNINDHLQLNHGSSNKHDMPIDNEVLEDNSGQAVSKPNGATLLKANEKKENNNVQEINIKESKVNALETVINPKPEHDLRTSELRPNLMGRIPHLGEIVSLSEVTKPEDRLLLVGGLSGFLDNMKENNVVPDVKMFTQLLETIPNTEAAEQLLLAAVKSYKLRLDLDFYNMLIRKRSLRLDYEGGKEVLMMIKKAGYKPDLITYGVLALGCKTKQEALELLEEMNSKRYRVNTEILGAMLHQAAYHFNFQYVIEIMEISLREGIKPNEKFMECLEEFRKRVKNISNDKRNKQYYSSKFRDEHKRFRRRYESWVQQVEVDDSKDVHPWQQFREPVATDTYKDKEARFEPVRTSKFKVKTSPKHIMSNT